MNYLVCNFLPIVSNMNIDELKNYFGTDNVIPIDKKTFEFIVIEFSNYKNKIKKFRK